MRPNIYDVNDHDDLRHEQLFGVVLGQLESDHPRCAPLAGKSTLNRLEQAMHVPGDLFDSRYVKMSLAPGDDCRQRR
ncbi:transposase [Halomicronema hongdechloris]|uniref:transposase n=1 Tax=Halomicronema hongdechloris TaxID=1209493 RepID=UPI0009BBE924|nr:transposase [Halomicronema hongdechloris]